MSKWLRRATKLAGAFQVGDGKRFRLASIDPRDTGGFASKRKAQAHLARGIRLLGELQEKLYAQDRWALLLIFQAMDAAGKDSTIKHVMSGVNPQGCQVYSFKAPSAEELDHDFLWRTRAACPSAAGSASSTAPTTRRCSSSASTRSSSRGSASRRRLVTKRSGRSASRTSTPSSATCTRNGTIVRKFFLHVSKEEQRKRFLERLDEPEKNWKFSPADVARARALGRLHGRLRGHDPPHEHGRTRPGTSCPPTTSGSRGWSWSRRSSRRSPPWSSPCRPSSPTA